MPHTQSAKKALRQNLKRRAANRATKKTVKTQVKKFLGALTVSGGTAEQRQAEYNAAAAKLDKAAKKRVIHPNAASRKKSQLARRLNAAAAAK